MHVADLQRLTLATAAEEVSKSEDSANLTATQILANTINLSYNK